MYLALVDDRVDILTLLQSSLVHPRMILGFVYSCRFFFKAFKTFPEQNFAYRPNILGVLTETLSMFALSGRIPYLTFVTHTVVHLLKFSIDAYDAEFQ